MRAPRYAFLDHPGPLAIAHRGGGRERPDNTMAAFAHAVALGYRYVETDVRVTRDGILIAFHPPALDGVTDARGRVGELTWAEVSRARVQGREPIARFEDLLGAWPDLRINVEPKCDEAVEPLAAAIRRTGAIDRVCVGSFSGARIRRIQALLGRRLCTSLGPAGVARLRLMSLGLRRGGEGFVEGAAQVAVRHYGVRVVDRAFVRAAERHGLHVHVWTVDEPGEMIRLLDLGVDGIMSGRPSVLKEALTRRGAWTGG